MRFLEFLPSILLQPSLPKIPVALHPVAIKPQPTHAVVAAEQDACAR